MVTVGCLAVPAALLAGPVLMIARSLVGSGRFGAVTAVDFAGGVMLVAAVVVPGLLVLGRSAAWLEDASLTVRGPFRSRTVALPAATAISVRRSVGGVLVLAVSGGTGQPVTLRLRGRDGAALPPPQFAALALAVARARCPGAHEVAGWLDSVARDPRTPLA